jgi:hypothetical protein
MGSATQRRKTGGETSGKRSWRPFGGELRGSIDRALVFLTTLTVPPGGTRMVSVRVAPVERVDTTGRVESRA